jgi:3-methyladenine DNA glycosylase AlkD
MPADRQLIDAIRSELRAVADPGLAPGMQAYMKSSMPFLGVRLPAVRTIVRAQERLRPPAGLGQLVATVAKLWEAANYREERYAATALLDTAAARRLLGPPALPQLRTMIVTGAWWDHVDELAHRVGDLLSSYRADTEPAIRSWITVEDRWLRRASIICQLGAKTDTDTDLLSDAIDANAADQDFFIRKAIGWALRDYARTDPDWVRAFVAGRGELLSPLSQREALKHLMRGA